MLLPNALNVDIVATDARVGVTGIIAALTEFRIAANNRYFFSCLLISANEYIFGKSDTIILSVINILC